MIRILVNKEGQRQSRQADGGRRLVLSAANRKCSDFMASRLWVEVRVTCTSFWLAHLLIYQWGVLVPELGAALEMLNL